MLTHVIVSGFVQGVGYRQFVKKIALDLGLTGWVKNIDNGRVEAMVCGSKDKIEQALTKMRKGTFLSDVKEIKIESEDKDMDFNTFEILV